MHTSAKRIDVATAAGVSESTVSRALSNSSLISPAVRERVRAVARSLGYVPSIQARNFAQSKTYRIGFIVRSYKSFPPFSRPYFPAVLDGAVLAAEQLGYSVTIILDKHGEDYKNLVDVVKSRQVDGLMFIVIPIGDKRIESLIKHKVPFVLINDYREDCHSVDGRPIRGMRDAFERMAALGHQNFGFVTGDMNYRNARDRHDTFNTLCEEFGVKSFHSNGDFSRTSGYRAAGKFLQSSSAPTVIMTSSDRQAFGVLEYCREHKIHIPEDISVIGYDNLYPANDVLPSLSTINNPIQQAGTTGAQLLIDVIENRPRDPVNIWLDTGFVIRQSTGPCKRGNS